MGLEVITVAAHLHLLGVLAVLFYIIIQYMTDKLGKQPGRSPTGRYIGSPEAVGRQSADVTRPLQNHGRLPLARGGNGRHDSSRSSAYDNYIVLAALGPQEYREKQS